MGPRTDSDEQTPGLLSWASEEEQEATPTNAGSMGGVTFDRVQSAPRIVLMGSRRSGKTSMERVVFGKISPHETLFLPSTSTPTLRLVSSSDLARFAIFDIPGGCDLSELQHDGSQLTPFAVFSRCVALVYVIDAEAEPYVECARFAEVVAAARQVNPRLALEVFVHKVDGDLFLTEEQKLDCRREIEGCVRAELNDLSVGRGSGRSGSGGAVSPPVKAPRAVEVLKRPPSDETPARGPGDSTASTAASVSAPPPRQEPPPLISDEVSFSLTSIYDHSVFEAFSKVISKRLVPQRAALERMLDALVAACDMDKSFLFDVASRVYIATDSAPVDSASYELCADAIDVVLDVGGIYVKPKTEATVVPSPRSTVAPSQDTEDPPPDTPPADDLSAAAAAAASSSEAPPPDVEKPLTAPPAPAPPATARTHQGSSASVTLSNGMSLVFDEVDPALAVVCLVRTESLDKPLIDYNLMCFRTALHKLSDLAHSCY